MMVVVNVDEHGRPFGDSYLAIDTSQAGIGDHVLVNEEGGGSMMLMKRPGAAVNKCIAGIVDYVEINGKQSYLDNE